MSDCKWPEGTCACYARKAVKPDYAGRVWMHCEEGLSMIKPLIWESPSSQNNNIYQAHSPWGTYGIHICGGCHRAWLEAHEKPYERWLGEGVVGSLFEAQKQAENHYRTQVLSLLQPFELKGETDE